MYRQILRREATYIARARGDVPRVTRNSYSKSVTSRAGDSVATAATPAVNCNTTYSRLLHHLQSAAAPPPVCCCTTCIQLLHPPAVACCTTCSLLLQHLQSTAAPPAFNCCTTCSLLLHHLQLTAAPPAVGCCTTCSRLLHRMLQCRSVDTHDIKIKH